ncbi:hypothetical protein KL909_000199 [Ogataea angusta]|nr:hypothetical protein KL909_000199 [Ogataea angusta]
MRLTIALEYLHIPEDRSLLERQTKNAAKPRASCLLTDPKMCFVTQYGRASVYGRQELHVLFHCLVPA